jgi:hypothetical protein
MNSELLYITRKLGKFVSTPDRAVFGKTLSLGVNTTADDIIEDDEDNFQKCEDNEESPGTAQIGEI